MNDENELTEYDPGEFTIENHRIRDDWTVIATGSHPYSDANITRRYDPGQVLNFKKNGDPIRGRIKPKNVDLQEFENWNIRFIGENLIAVFEGIKDNDEYRLEIQASDDHIISEDTEVTKDVRR